MSMFITVHEKINGTAVAINTDHIFTICTGVTGTTITLRTRNFIWCTETMDEILQMIEAVAGYPVKDSDGCKGCRYEHLESDREPCRNCQKCYINRYRRRPGGNE